MRDRGVVIRSHLVSKTHLLAAVVGLLVGCSRTDVRTTQADPVHAGTNGNPWADPLWLRVTRASSACCRAGKPLYIKVDPATVGSRTLTVGLEDMPPGDSIGVHKHLGEDEVVFVHRGELDVTLGDDHHHASAGATVFIPRGTWIGFRVLGQDTATVLFAFNTPGFEQCLRLLPAPAGERYVPPADSVIAAARRQCHHVRRADVR